MLGSAQQQLREILLRLDDVFAESPTRGRTSIAVTQSCVRGQLAASVFHVPDGFHTQQRAHAGAIARSDEMRARRLVIAPRGRRALSSMIADGWFAVMINSFVRNWIRSTVRLSEESTAPSLVQDASTMSLLVTSARPPMLHLCRARRAKDCGRSARKPWR